MLADFPANVAHFAIAHEDIVNTGSFAVRFEAEVGRGMRLGVEIQHADPFTLPGEGRRQVDRRGGFPDAALLINDRYPSHDIPRNLVEWGEYHGHGDCPDHSAITLSPFQLPGFHRFLMIRTI